MQFIMGHNTTVYVLWYYLQVYRLTETVPVSCGGTHKSASSSSRNVSLKCSVCNSLSTNAVHVCESGHVVCKNCQTADDAKASRRDGGDFYVEGLAPYTCNMKCNHHKFKKNHSEPSCTQPKDLASGDHDKRDKAPKAKHNAKSESKINSRENNVPVDNYCRKSAKINEDSETILEYENANFHKSQSSIVSLSNDELLRSVNNEYQIECNDNDPNNCKVFPRPVTCPVVNCGKMIAMDSVLLHFYFDHSKVERVTLTVGTPQQIFLKPGNITHVTECSTMFLLKSKTKSKQVQNKVVSNVTLNKSTTDCNPILLMAVRIQDDTKIVGSKQDTKLIKLRHVSTQTEFTESKCTTVSKKNNLSKPSKENEDIVSSITKYDTFGNNEILLLWLCKLDDESVVYKITIESTNKKQAYMYTGEAIYIREKQEYSTIYEKSECLVLRGAAVNKLLDEIDQIIINITILD